MPRLLPLMLFAALAALGACGRGEEAPNKAVQADRRAAEARPTPEPGQGSPARKPLAWEEPSTERTSPDNVPQHRGGAKETS